jgi:uncharacterized membrane protein YsdA (DUF1294 family)/cold shock CspA family protein
MRDHGKIVRWEAAKGFGFIRSSATSQDVFVHVSDCWSRDGAGLRAGVRVTFEVVHIGGKGPRAVQVQPAFAPHEHGAAAASPQAALSGTRAARRRNTEPVSGGTWIFPVVLAYGLALLWLVWHRQVPWWVLPASFFVNAATFFAYWQDKHAAQTGRWRLSEQTLHLWSLAGGWGGAWIAQRVLRHKSLKASFRSSYFATVVTHCLLVSAIWWWFL